MWPSGTPQCHMGRVLSSSLQSDLDCFKLKADTLLNHLLIPCLQVILSQTDFFSFFFFPKQVCIWWKAAVIALMLENICCLSHFWQGSFSMLKCITSIPLCLFFSSGCLTHSVTLHSCHRSWENVASPDSSLKNWAGTLSTSSLWVHVYL